MITGHCKIRGLITFDFNSDLDCKDPECGLCALFHKALGELVRKDGFVEIDVKEDAIQDEKKSNH